MIKTYRFMPVEKRIPEEDFDDFEMPSFEKKPKKKIPEVYMAS